MYFFSIALILYVILGVVTYVYNVLIKKRANIFHFKFSKLNYYILMSPFVFALLIQAVLLNSYSNIILFLAYGVFGVLGETTFSLWWDLLFEKKFWVYTDSTIFNEYSSILNFLPWGVGGFMFMQVVNRLNLPLNNPIVATSINLPWYITFFAVFFAVLVFTFIIAYFSRPRKKFDFEFKNVNLLTYSIFVLPIVISLAVITVFYAKDFLILFVAFAAVAFVAEYIFGKMCVKFVSKKLWTYTYFTIDNNHTSPLNILPFGIGGIYFWLIFMVVSSLITK